MTYNKKLLGVSTILLGSFLLIEHLWTWDEVAFFDFLGHEWLGFILIIFGIGLNINWDKKRYSKELISIKNRIMHG